MTSKTATHGTLKTFQMEAARCPCSGKARRSKIQTRNKVGDFDFHNFFG